MEAPPATRGCPLDPGCRGTLGLSYGRFAGQDVIDETTDGTSDTIRRQPLAFPDTSTNARTARSVSGLARGLIAFCITELDPGGAERAMARLVRSLDRERWSPHRLLPRTRYAAGGRSGRRAFR